MNNGNLPANPTTLAIDEYEGTINCPTNRPLTGLTKREHFAGLAMAAWIEHHGTCGSYGYSDIKMAESAVMSADALLKELAK